MKTLIDRLKLQKEFDRILILHFFHGFFFFFVLIDRLAHDLTFSSFLIRVIFFAFIYHVYYRTAKNVFYTYWTISALLLLYLLNSFFFVGDLSTSFLSMLGIIFIALQGLMLNTPYYYPRVSWWVYDFRYRDDLIVDLEFKGDSSKARLTDLRKLAGCVATFEKINVGDKFDVLANFNDQEIKLHAEVFSKRQEIIGRPYLLGVKFHLKDKDEKIIYSKFGQYWRSSKRAKESQKFQEV